MKAEENASRILSALDAELKRRHGHIAGADAGISRSEGYLARVRRGKTEITIDRLLKTLELIDVEPGLFFVNALRTPVSRDAVLKGLQVDGKVLAGLHRIEKATIALEQAPDETERATGGDPGQLVARVAACGDKEQWRRLKNTTKYRTALFAAAFLDHLDSLRYDDPSAAARRAQTVALHFVPSLRCGRLRRLALQLTAIGVYASARRMTGSYATAARGLVFALDMAKRHGLATVAADLLQRAAYLLSDHGRFAEAMMLLDEALVIYFDAGSESDLGRVLVDRGHMFNYLGNYQAAIRAFSRALLHLKGDDPKMRRNQLAACMNRAISHRSLGDLDGMERSLEEALSYCGREGSINEAKVVWELGNVAMEGGAYALAETHFRSAYALFEREKTNDRIPLTLDLTKALVCQNQMGAAAGVALGMAQFLKNYRANSLLRAALTEFLRLVLAGQLSLPKVEELRAKVGTQRTRRAGARESG
ncbi:MAG: hypothetical protein GY719_06145 [bacterium]|nr:hypothetical protein [bacterium]